VRQEHRQFGHFSPKTWPFCPISGRCSTPCASTANRADSASSSASRAQARASSNALCQHDPKRIITPVVNRTLHTYHSTLRILCEAFQIEADGADFRCEKRLIEEARRLNTAGKMLAPIIDDAHLMDVAALRKIRLLFEDFPKNHCLVLVAQPELMSRLALTVNEDLKNRVTYSVLLQKLAPDSLADFIRAELDKVALAHSTFTDDALSLILRSSEGGLRRVRNLCLRALLEAVRDRTKVVDLKQVNRVLLQPHWRKEVDLPR
jgi:type II secretory pathway predicted ATPase ExeA